MILPVLAFGLLASCASSPAEPVPQVAEVEPNKKLWDRKSCPTEASIHGIVNMMGGPGFDREKVRAQVTAEIVATGFWGASVRHDEDQQTFTVSIFRSSRMVKPVARPLTPVQKPRKPWETEPSIADDPSNARLMNIKYAPSPSRIRKLILMCGGKPIAEGQVQRVH